MHKIKFIAPIVSLFVFAGMASPVKAQNIEMIRADRQTYLSGMGSGTTLKAADQAALTEIIEQISVQVESSFETIKTEINKDFNETVKDVVRTYSGATLNNTERIIIQDEPNAKVFRYVKRNDIAKIFESRKNKIIELAHNGEIALENLQIADALRYFYWSQTMLRSHPESSEIKMQSAGKEVLLITWLPMQINQIFSNVRVNVDTIEQDQSYSFYILNVLFRGKPVVNFDYTYWSGQDWSNIVSSKDGIGIVELPKLDDRKEIRLKAEYAFEGEANIDQELRNVMEKLSQVPYKNSYFSISALPKPKATGIVPTEDPLLTIDQTKSDSIKNLDLATAAKPSGTIRELNAIEEDDKAMNDVVTAIMQKNFIKEQHHFTDEGYSTFQKLLQYGDAQIIKSFNTKYYQYGDYTICRSIPMSFRFKTNNRTFVEDVVFYFDRQHKICNLTFGLSKKSVEDIASNDSWSDENKILLISFLENYKTAFSLKRFDYINNIFSDDALIITGLVTKIASTTDSPYANNTIVKYNRQTKAEYMRKLKYSFDSKEYINIRFADNNVRRSGKGNDVYGIQIKQDYFSTNYGDSGYLFLLVDLSDTLRPQIHVRTWQPEKNADGSIYGLSDF
jgi:hypothetical protein